VAAAPSTSEVAGPVTAAAAVALNAVLLRGAARLARRDSAMAEADGYAAEKRFFRFSIIYLFGHFAALMADAVLAGLSLTGA